MSTLYPRENDRVIHYTDPNTGYETTLHSIGYLAAELGRVPQTIRKWEISGAIPKTPFTVRGRRYYCDEQIQIVVECAENARLSSGIPPSTTTFTPNVEKRWRELFKKIFGDTTSKE